MTEPRAFPLADVLSVTTPLLLSERKVEGLTDLLNWMTGDELELWQLSRAADEARPALIAQHPFLADLQPPAASGRQRAPPQAHAVDVAGHGDDDARRHPGRPAADRLGSPAAVAGVRGPPRSGQARYDRRCPVTYLRRFATTWTDGLLNGLCRLQELLTGYVSPRRNPVRIPAAPTVKES